MPSDGTLGIYNHGYIVLALAVRCKNSVCSIQGFSFSLVSRWNLYEIVNQALHTNASSVTSSLPSCFSRASNMKHVFTHVNLFFPSQAFRIRNRFQSHDTPSAFAVQSSHCRYVQALSNHSPGGFGNTLRRLRNINSIDDSMFDGFEI